MQTQQSYSAAWMLFLAAAQKVDEITGALPHLVNFCMNLRVAFPESFDPGVKTNDTPTD